MKIAHSLIAALTLVMVPLVMVPVASAGENRARYIHEGPILVRDVTIIDGLGRAPLSHREVLIQNGRIAQVAVANTIHELPEATHVIDGDGLTLIPGLIDMHVHFMGGWNMTDPGYPLKRDPLAIDLSLWNLLYAGVTTFLDLGNDQEWITSLRDEIAAGERIGPRIVATGETLHSLEGVNKVLELPGKGVEQIEKLLDEKQALGIDIIKLYADLSIWEARFIMEEAHKRGMRGVADFWYMNLSRDAAQVSGVDGFAHGGAVLVSSDDARWLKDNSRFAIPTLTTLMNLGGQRVYEDIDTQSFAQNPLIVDVLGPNMVREYYDAFYSMREKMHDGRDSFYRKLLFGDMTRLWELNRRNVKTLHEAGVIVAAGTDAPFPQGNWLGEAIHHELELLAECGIPNVEVIKIASYNAATILRREDEFGSIQEGLIADLVVVEGNPAENISDTRNVRYLIQGGRLIDRDSLTGHWRDLKQF